MLRLHTRMRAEYNGLLESPPACSSYVSLTVLNLVVGNIPLGAAVTTLQHSGTLNCCTSSSVFCPRGDCTQQDTKSHEIKHVSFLIGIRYRCLQLAGIVYATHRFL